MPFDSVRIVITRNCDADGKGGEIVDDAAVVLPEIAPGVQLLDVTCLAVIKQRGLHTVAAPTEFEPNNREPVSKYRNLAVAMRQGVEQYVQSYLQQAKMQEVQKQGQDEYAAILAKLNVVEGGTV